MPAGRHKAILGVSLLVFGTCSALLVRWANETSANGVNRYDNPRKFQHPFIQCLAMFIGEFLCFLPYLLLRIQCKSSPEANPVPVCKWLLFLLPALLEIIASTVIYVGLNFTYHSSYQMLRGTVVVFTGLLSVAFLGRSIRRYMWIGIATLTVGLIVAGLAEAVILGVNTDANGIVAGDLLVILGLIIYSTQFVYEEKYLKKHNVPATLAVGLEVGTFIIVGNVAVLNHRTSIFYAPMSDQCMHHLHHSLTCTTLHPIDTGFFGGAILGVLLVPMYYMRASKPFSMNPGHLEDVWDALAQMRNNWYLIAATIGLVVSSSVASYLGVKVTKDMSATTRQVILTGRVFLVWIVAIGVQWEPFEYRSFILKLIGFFIMIVGILIYHDVIFRPCLIRHHCLEQAQNHGFGMDNSNDELGNERDDEDVQLLM